jgi:protein TonB
VAAEILPEELRSLTRPGERKLLWLSFCAALAIHVVVLLINFPAFEEPTTPQREHTPIVVKRYVPPPPEIERPRTRVTTRQTRKIPIPDPTPDLPEPIVEPKPAIVLDAVPGEVEVLFGDPAPPAERRSYGEPRLAGVGDVGLPVRIPESYVEPEYPEMARVARLEGRVILQAVIDGEGLVREIEVLRCNRPYVGFEEAATVAVQQWRYEPAMQNERPVSVFFTIRVDFELL